MTPLIILTNVTFEKCSFTSILVAHFILNLRTFDQFSTDTDRSDIQYSSVRFARSITGNIGAPLQDSFTINEEPPLSATPQQQRENPLAVGILDKASAPGPRFGSISLYRQCRTAEPSTPKAALQWTIMKMDKQDRLSGKWRPMRWAHLTRMGYSKYARSYEYPLYPRTFCQKTEREKDMGKKRDI